MKSAIGMLVAVFGGLLIYDGFAGRSVWSDMLAVLRGQANGAGAGNSLANPNAAPNPALAGGGDAQGSTGQPTASPVHTQEAAGPPNPITGEFPKPYYPIGPIVGIGRAI